MQISPVEEDARRRRRSSAVSQRASHNSLASLKTDGEPAEGEEPLPTLRQRKLSSAGTPVGPILASARNGESMVHLRMRMESSTPVLTPLERKHAVGEWMFGDGGLRGLASRKEDDFIEEVVVQVGGTGVVKRGMVLELPGPQRGGGGRATGSLPSKPTKLETMMSAYVRQSAEMYADQKLIAASDEVALAVMHRAAIAEKWYNKVHRALVRSGRRLSQCVTGCWHGPQDDAVTDVNARPIAFSGFYRRTVDKIGATQAHLRQLRLKFREIDKSELGFICIQELFQFLGEKPSPILERLHSQLIVIFDSFDLDGDNHLDEEEVCSLIAVINSEEPMYPGNLLKILSSYEADSAGRTSFAAFTRLHRTYPLALFPIFKMHDMVQIRTLGEVEFNRLANAAAPLRDARAAAVRLRTIPSMNPMQGTHSSQLSRSRASEENPSPRLSSIDAKLKSPVSRLISTASLAHGAGGGAGAGSPASHTSPYPPTTPTARKSGSATGKGLPSPVLGPVAAGTVPAQASSGSRASQAAAPTVPLRAVSTPVRLSGTSKHLGQAGSARGRASAGAGNNTDSSAGTGASTWYSGAGSASSGMDGSTLPVRRKVSSSNVSGRVGMPGQRF